jgi:aminopeptidase N
VNSYSFISGVEIAEGVITNAVNALKSFDERFGKYPYTEFDIVSTPMLALGMEYPGLIAITLELYDSEGEFRGTPNSMFIEGVIAHEVGHQWFFNTVGSDQIDEPWLDEAITQYVTGLYFLDLYGESGWIGSRQSWLGRWDRVDGADIPIGLPAGDYAGPEYGAIVYGRGPLFVEDLSKVMGQTTFDDFLRDYYQTYKWGQATSELFQELAEQHCSCDLSELFDEWVYGE